ncbi:NAD(P)/FAD-dependent oxidoreductase [Sphingobacterium faecale]|uniref:NAD(P)/FAD-dependent oxidoreductase n=1 Tax=Sphingobacterium faecale TaxID=2803775 RepID=A0ABS1QXZ7_9SPHI|nr:NAD(P)/FAD-dependent oxidoreductase [Sphingobacterium faecale]MBL1407174.1 NAD(P)/FAD-dependent oxidoreductase [Sphingobacterium faecale]
MKSIITKKQFDVIIIGGSYSGLSAGMALGRSLRRILIIDSGKPCNRYTPRSHNFLTQDGEEPAVILQKAEDQLVNYESVEFLNEVALSAKAITEGFQVTTTTGVKVYSKKLLLATGIKDIFPKIIGFEGCWGKTVIHCPYCHGYEFKGKKTAIIANGDRAFHLASLVNNLTDQLSIITSDRSTLTQVQLSKLYNHHIRVIENDVAEIIHNKGVVNRLVFKNGSTEDFEALYTAIPFEQQTDIPLILGCEMTENGLIKVDMFQRTTISGIYSCGDNSSPMRSVANAVATGNIAGAILNHDLTVETF